MAVTPVVPDYSLLEEPESISPEQARNLAELITIYTNIAPSTPEGVHRLDEVATYIQRNGLQKTIDTLMKTPGTSFEVNLMTPTTPRETAIALVDRLYKDANIAPQNANYYQNWVTLATKNTPQELVKQWNKMRMEQAIKEIPERPGVGVFNSTAARMARLSKITPEELEGFTKSAEEARQTLMQNDINNFIQSANKIYKGFDLTPNYGPDANAEEVIKNRLQQFNYNANENDIASWTRKAQRYGLGTAIADLDRDLAIRGFDLNLSPRAPDETFKNVLLPGQLPSTYIGSPLYQERNYAQTPVVQPGAPAGPTAPSNVLVPSTAMPGSSNIPIQGVPQPTLPQTTAPTNIPIQGVPLPTIPAPRTTDSFIQSQLQPQPQPQPQPEPVQRPSFIPQAPVPQPLIGTAGGASLLGPMPQPMPQPQPQMTNEEFIQQQQAPVEMADGGSVGGASSGVRRLKMSGYQDGGDVSNDEYIQEMMTGTLPTDQGTNPGILPPEVREAIDVPLDLANLLVRGVAAVPAGGFAGLYKGLTGGKYGTQEGVKEADIEAGRVMSQIMGEPKTQAAKDLLEFIGEKTQEYKLDAALPQLLTLPSPGPGSANYVGQQALRSVENTTLEGMKRITGNPNLSVQDIYRAISEEQLPVSAITKPTASTDLGIKKLEGGLIFPEDETAERLRLKMQRQQAFEEKGKAMPGAPKNARTVIKAPKGSDLPDFVVGDIKPQDWIARTEKMLSPDEIQQYGRWYDDVRGTFLKYTDGDEDLTDKYMRAWLVANQNIGVEGAFNNVLLQAEQFARNVPADQMRAGGLPFATQAARNALQDEPITEGVGLKIADFVDSAEGKGTRSIYGNAREAGAPFVVDIHTARDTGLVDDILLNHLERNGYKVDRNQIKTDLATGPTDTQYENRADFGRNLTQYLNDNNWQGRNDWTPKEIQAIGWMAMTKLTRDAADDTVTALERSLRRLSMEFSPGEGSPWAVKFGDRFNALEPEGQRELTQVATSRAVDMAKQVAGIDLRSVVHGSGGWQKFQNPATVAQTLATKEGSEIAANALGYLLNQTEVWSNAVKGMTKNPKAFAVDFVQKKGDDLSTDQGIMSFWEKVMEADPTGLFVGYQPIRTANNEPGIRVIVDKGGAKRMQDIQAALEGPIAKMIKDSPLDIDARGYENELVKAVNNWKENPDGQLYLARLADLGIGDPAARLNPLRSELETAIESWFSNRAGAAKAGSKAAAPESSPASASASAPTAAGGVKRRGKGTTTAAEDLAAVSPTAPAVSRIEMGYKDVTKRVPELTQGARDLLDGKITWEDYNALVDQYKPVTPYSFVPQPATAADAMKALDSNKKKSFSVVQTGIQAGEPTELRLDIPAYKGHGVWVNSIHRPGQPTSYASISSIKNARMIGPDDVRLQEKALEVATGEKNKGPFAVIKGEWEPVSEKDAVARAQQYLNDPEWTQVGYDPERHSYFYDRTTTQPVVAADEVLQIGPLVLAKNAKFAEKGQFKYKDGGEVTAFIKAKAR